MPKKSDVQQRAAVGRNLTKIKDALKAVQGRAIDELGILDVGRVLSAWTGASLKSFGGVKSAVELERQDGTILASPEIQIPIGHPLYSYAKRWVSLVGERDALRRRAR